MEPNRIGRLLGIGTRVAAGKLRGGTAGAIAAVERGKAERAAAERTAEERGVAKQGAVPAEGSGSTRPAAAPVVNGPAVAEGRRRLARGAGQFGASVWKPFAHATGVLGLQITGLLFAFFALGFGAKSWQLYRDAGWSDHHLPLYAGFGVLFLWFAVSSFWKASRKS